MPINSPDVFDYIGDAIVSGSGGGGVTTFVALNDTPTSYTGQGSKFVAVNSGATALEFVDAPSGVTTFVGLNDTPSSFTGSANRPVVVNGGASALIFSSTLKATIIGQTIQYSLSDTALSSAGDHEGEILVNLGSGSKTLGNVLYWDGTNWQDADASAEATAKGLLSIATQTGNPNTGVLHQGFIKLATAPGTAGDVLYLSETAGGLTATAPTTAGAIVRVMGYDVDGAGLVYFNPSPDWLELV